MAYRKLLPARAVKRQYDGAVARNEESQMSRSSRFNAGRWAAVLAVMGALVLSGCAAPTVSARVTSFQQWPTGVEGQTLSLIHI